MRRSFKRQEIYFAKKQSDDLVPILFSDWRACEPLENLDNRQTFIDVEDITLPAIKYALTDREKVSVDSSEGHTTFQVLENGLQISTGLTVVLGKRSSGKSLYSSANRKSI